MTKQSKYADYYIYGDDKVLATTIIVHIKLARSWLHRIHIMMHGLLPRCFLPDLHFSFTRTNFISSMHRLRVKVVSYLLLA